MDAFAAQGRVAPGPGRQSRAFTLARRGGVSRNSWWGGVWGRRAVEDGDHGSPAKAGRYRRGPAKAGHHRGPAEAGRYRGRDEHAEYRPCEKATFEAGSQARSENGRLRDPAWRDRSALI